MNPSGYYDAATIRESHMSKLTTLEMLKEVAKRFEAMTSTDGRPQSAASLAREAIGLVNWMEKYP